MYVSWPADIIPMKLLSERDLIWSPVVANSKMNRERNASGVNSYEQECRCRLEDIIKGFIDKKGRVSWLDLCCGQGKALIQVAGMLAEEGLQDKAVLKGIDLVDPFMPAPAGITCLELKAGSVVDWIPRSKYDLITCIHGLHYVGDKLKVLQRALSALSAKGIFMANLDLNNIHIVDCRSQSYLKNIFRENHIRYNARSRMLECKGRREINFGVTYTGASDQAGPNYTGQEAVMSCYTLV